MAKKDNKIDVAEVHLIRCMHGDHKCPYCGKRTATTCNIPSHCGHCGYPLKSHKIRSNN